MIDVKKELSKELNHKKLDAFVIVSDPDKNNPINQADMFIRGLEKDRNIYHDLFSKHQFLQLKIKKQSLSENLETWIGFDESNGNLIQVCLCLRCKIDDQTNAMTHNDGCDRVLKKVAKSRLPFKGPGIALIGSDGSGKSTVTLDLEKWLSEKIDCRRYYLGSGEHYNSIYKRCIKMMIRGFRLSRDLNKKQTVKAGENELDQTQVNSVKKGLKNWYCHINAFYLYRISVRTLKQLRMSNGFSKGGGIRLFDRYPQNQFMGINDGPKIRKLYGNINSSVINRLIQMEEENINRCVKMSPDLVIKLVISPEVAILRKPDHNIPELEKKTDIIRNLNFENTVVQNIDANQKYEEELRTIKKLIWDYLFQLSKMNG